MIRLFCVQGDARQGHSALLPFKQKFKKATLTFLPILSCNWSEEYNLSLLCIRQEVIDVGHRNGSSLLKPESLYCGEE